MGPIIIFVISACAFFIFRRNSTMSDESSEPLACQKVEEVIRELVDEYAQFSSVDISRAKYAIGVAVEESEEGESREMEVEGLLREVIRDFLRISNELDDHIDSLQSIRNDTSRRLTDKQSADMETFKSDFQEKLSVLRDKLKVEL